MNSAQWGSPKHFHQMFNVTMNDKSSSQWYVCVKKNQLFLVGQGGNLTTCGTKMFIYNYLPWISGSRIRWFFGVLVSGLQISPRPSQINKKMKVWLRYFHHLGTDVEFAVHRLACRRETTLDWRSSQLRGLERLAMRCVDMDEAIQARLHPSVKQVTRDVKFGLILVLTILLKWPDWEMPDMLAAGVQTCWGVGLDQFRTFRSWHSILRN